MGSVVSISFSGADKVIKNLKNFQSIAEPIYQRAIEAAEATMGKYSVRDPIPWRTGNLLHSFRFETGRLWAKWYPTAPYAAAVNDGSGPYVINNGFGRGIKINHPGTKPRRYMQAIAENSIDDIGKLFNQATEKVANAIAK